MCLGIGCLSQTFDEIIYARRRVHTVVGEIAVGLDVERNFVGVDAGAAGANHKGVLATQRMTHAKLVVDVRIVYGNVSNHEVGRQQTLKHVETNVSLPADLHCRPASDFQPVQRRIDQLLLNLVEINVVLRAERPNDERSHCYCSSTSLVEMSKMIEPEMFNLNFLREYFSDL